MDSEHPIPPARPTPVRALMQAEPPPREADPEVDGRSFEHEGVRWIVRNGGATRSGSGKDRGAPLLRLDFNRADGGAPERSILTVGRSVEEVDEDLLPELLARASPLRTPPG